MEPSAPPLPEMEELAQQNPSQEKEGRCIVIDDPLPPFTVQDPYPPPTYEATIEKYGQYSAME